MSLATQARHRLREVCVCVRVDSFGGVSSTMSLGQDHVSPMFNEVLRAPMHSALNTLCHWSIGYGGAGGGGGAS